MEFAPNFTAIDFETASHRKDSACQLAAVRVRDGKIVDSAMWMIRPEPFFFTQGNIRIHGIHPDDVVDEPSFGELWAEISETLGDDCLVAHNASFDIGVLQACLKKHRKTIPTLEYTCTRAIARRTWKHRRRFGLKPLSDWLGVRFKHHDALEDSIACAKVLLAAGIDKKAETLESLEKKLRLSRGTLGPSGFVGPGKRSHRRAKPKPSPETLNPKFVQLHLPMGDAEKIPKPILPNTSMPVPSVQPTELTHSSGIDLQRLLVRAEFVRPLAGKRIVFSGKLQAFSDDFVQQLVQRSGGKRDRKLGVKTNLIVVGEGNTDASHDLDDVDTVSEAEFLAMVGASPTRVPQ